MPTASINQANIIVNGIRYFRGNASTVSLGAFGRKKTPLFGQNYLEVYGNVGLVGVDLRPPLVMDVDQKAIRQALVETGGTISGNNSVKVSGNSKVEQDWELKLVQFAMTLSDVRHNVVSDDDRDDLRAIGRMGRVAYQVWTVMRAEEVVKLTRGTRVEVGVDAGTIKVTAVADATNEVQSEITLSEGSTFAYLLAKMTTDGLFTTDQWGLE